MNNVILQTSKVEIFIWTNINIYIYVYVYVNIYIHIYETCSIKEILQLLRHCIRGEREDFYGPGGRILNCFTAPPPHPNSELWLEGGGAEYLISFRSSPPPPTLLNGTALRNLPLAANVGCSYFKKLR